MVSGEISKGGECLFEVSISRNSNGVEIWVRASPSVEAFMRSLVPEDATVPTDALDIYGKTWLSPDPQNPIQVYKLDRDMDSTHYTLSAVGGSIAGYKMAGNVSFLRFVGVGSPEGVKFRIAGPISRDSIKGFKDGILTAARQLLRDYVVPVYINIRVTSTEL